MLGFNSAGTYPIGGLLILWTAVVESVVQVETAGEQTLDNDRGAEVRGQFLFIKPLSYRIVVADSTGKEIGEIDNFTKLNFGKRLNNYGTAEFNMAVRDSKSIELIDLRRNTIKIYRDYDQFRSLVWAGEQAVRRGLLNAVGNNWADVTCFTWFEQFRSRYTEAFERYELEDAGDVIEALIATTQGKTQGDFGVVKGTISPTYLADIIFQNDNIADAILSLADGGLDFEITDNKELNVAPIIGEDKTNSIVLEYGYNVSSMTIIEDFSDPVNQSIVLGEAIGVDNLQRIERTNIAYRANYKLRQSRLNQLEPAIEAIFDDKGDALIRKQGTPLLKVEFNLVQSISPSIDQFTIGDGIRLIVKDGFFNIDEQYRVFEWSVSIDKKNTEKLTLILGKFTI